MDGDSVTVVLVTLVVGALVPFIAEYLNVLFQADGKKALVVVGVLSAVVSAGVLFFTGGLQVSDLTLQNLVPVFNAVFTLSQIVFQLFRNALGWNVNRNVESRPRDLD